MAPQGVKSAPGALELNRHFGAETDLLNLQCRDADVVRTAQATDLAFNMLRNKAGLKSGWTEFNQSLSKNDQDVTAIGYMPILQAPAHELDT